MDFSSLAVGGVLSQVQGKRFIGGFSKFLNSAKSKYSAHKGELMAVILALRKYEHILRAKKFLIRTDSNSITYLQGLKEAQGIWAQWLIYLALFDFASIHRPGKSNTAADAALSHLKYKMRIKMIIYYILPLHSEGRQLPPKANLYLRWAKLVYFWKPVDNRKLLCVPRDQPRAQDFTKGG